MNSQSSPISSGGVAKLARRRRASVPKYKFTIRNKPNENDYGTIASEKDLHCELCNKELHRYFDEYNYDLYPYAFKDTHATDTSDCLLVGDILVCSVACADLWLLAPIKLEVQTQS